MCNCINAPCNKCSRGQNCSCPPNYSVSPVPTNCGCCPPGAVYIPPTINNPSGKCADSNGNTVPMIACIDCTDSTLTDCVFYQLNPGNPINCFGIASGDNLTTIIQKICANLAPTVLSQISNSPSLETILCNLVVGCPPSGKGIPVVTITSYCCPGNYTYYGPNSSTCTLIAPGTYNNGCCVNGNSILQPTPC